VALANLLKELAIPPDAVVEAAAQDGFVTQLPRDLVYANDGIVAVYGNRGRRHAVAANSR